MKYLEITGSYYDFGFEIGKYFKDYLNEIIEPYREKIKSKKVSKYVSLLEEKLKVSFPNCLQEIYGRADGSQIERPTMLLLFFPEIFKKVDGCTTIIAKTKSGILFAHNEDEKNMSPDHALIVKFINGNDFIIAFVWAERLAGSAFSFTSNKMIFSCNYIFDNKFDLKNISRYIAIREIINCKDLPSVIDKMKKYKVASAFNLNVVDLKSNSAMSIEKDTKKIYPKPVDTRFARANHFIIKKHKYKTLPPSTALRQEKVTELVDALDLNTCSIEDLHKVLSFQSENRAECILKVGERFDGKSKTMATFLFDPKKNVFTIIDHFENEKLCFDLNGNKL